MMVDGTKIIDSAKCDARCRRRLEGQSRIGERGGAEFRPLLDDERRGRGLVHPLGWQLDVADDRGLST